MSSSARHRRVFGAHLIAPIFVSKAFDPVAAVTLVIVTSVIGYFVGYIAGIIWNKLHRA